MNSPDSIDQQAGEALNKLPLASTPLFYSSPTHLRAAAHLYGIETVPVENARVLELGCGSGGNLLPFALAYPHAHVVGVDLWPDEIQRGNRAVQDLEVKNLHLQAKLFADIDQDFGTFDYIIVHDVFTWAPSAIREAILRICRENLSPLGIVYISYNTYPGWKAGDILRDAMQLHSHSATTMEDALPSAMAMLDLMSNGLANKNPHITSLKLAADKLRQHPEYYVNAEYLQTTNSGFYFIEFAETALQAGLAYVGDSEPQDELSSTHGQNVQLNHSLISIGQPKILRQQYLDFAIGRQFRKSLFVRKERTDDILMSPDTSRLNDFRWAASFRRVEKEAGMSSNATSYASYNGTKISLTNSIEISIVEQLSAAWPISVPFQSLVDNTKDITSEPTSENDQIDTVRKALENLFKYGELRYCLGLGPYDDDPNNKLRLLPGLVYLLAVPENLSSIKPFNFWHDSIDFVLSESEKKLLPAFAAGKSFEDIVDLLRSDSQPAPKAQDTEQQNANHNEDQRVTQLIDLLKRQGALLGSSAAWHKYFKTALLINAEKGFYGLSYIDPLILFTDAHRSKHSSLNNNAQKISHATNEITKRIALLRQKQKTIEAESLARKLTAQSPNDPFGWHTLSQTLFLQGKHQEGFPSLLKAIALSPREPGFHSDLCASLLSQKIDLEAELSARRALTLDPTYAPAWTHLGNVFRPQEKSKAELCYRQAIKLRPQYAAAYSNLAGVCADQGRLKEAISYYRKALDIEPNNLEIHSNWLFTLSQYDAIDAIELFNAHQDFGRKAELKIKGLPTIVHTNSRNVSRKLRLGFVSGDLRNHAVSSFIAPIWQLLNRDAFEIYAYDTSDTLEDAMQRQLRGYTQNWIRVAGTSDIELAKQISSDRIDILFDLSGHTGYNRLPMFALKPAPIQISWIGYPATTGLTTVDYYLVNKYQAPPGLLEDQFTEKLIRLPAAAAFTAASISPEINRLPALSNNHFTFGSFNRLSKVSEELFALWARILHQVPESRLLIGGISSTTSQDCKIKFQKYGINPERLILQPRTNVSDYLLLHHQVDLLLDTYPYNGGTTTMHGLWMGVPTLTLAGKSMPARTGIAIMGTIGLEKFVVESETEYLEKAISWSKELNELASIRAGMRERLQTSPLFSHKIVTQDLEKALKQAWGIWCQGKSPESFEIDP